MAARFTYSRWDGTQRGFDYDGDALLDELTDDLLYHGDVNSALRRLMQQGMTDADGNRLDGLKDLLQRLRQARADRLESSDLGGVYDEISRELGDIVDEERHAIDNALRDATNSGDDRRRETADSAAQDRHFRLDMLPNDLAGKVKELQSYDFESDDARQRFDNLLDRLRQQLTQQVADQMSSAMQAMTPDDVQRVKQMMAALNEMLQRRQAGQDPQFDAFMNEFGDMFPDNPETLDELLEQIARRMAAMQAMLNSMTPEQREQLRQLSEQLMDDLDLQWQMDQLSRNLQNQFPQMNWNRRYEFEGNDPLGMASAMQAMQDLGDLDELESLLRGAASPGQLAEADLDRVHDLLGHDAARSLRALAELSKRLEDSGLVVNTEGRLELSPKGLRALGNNALRDLFSKLAKNNVGRHQIERQGSGHERSYETKPYEFGDPFNLNLHRTVRNALARRAAHRAVDAEPTPLFPIRLHPDDFEIDHTEQLTRCNTVVMLDLSLSMPMRDNFLPAKKVAMALHALMSSQYPRDFLGLVGFSESACVLTPAQLPTVSWDFAYGTNMQHGLHLARQLLNRQTGNKQIIMITDGEPTAHVRADGEVFFHYPPVRETVEATLREVVRCTKDDIRINTFMLDADRGLRQFVEQMTSINRGRVFFTSPDTLGDYVLVDFIEHRRTVTRTRAS